MSKIDVAKSVLLLAKALASCEGEAIEYQVKILSEQGFEVRAAEIGEIYEIGSDEIAISLERAFRWYTQGAYEENDKDGFFGLARFYFYGIFVNKNPFKALEYFNNASNLGSNEADLLLGRIYIAGVDIPRDLAEAESHLILAARQGYVAAYHMLAGIEKSKKITLLR